MKFVLLLLAISTAFAQESFFSDAPIAEAEAASFFADTPVESADEAVMTYDLMRERLISKRSLGILIYQFQHFNTDLTLSLERKVHRLLSLVRTLLKIQLILLEQP
jgi:hypothetical protein